MKSIKSNKISTRLKAFGLVEVLISSVVLAIGLLGLASSQSKSLKLAQEAHNLAIATGLAEEMANRMLLNQQVSGHGNNGYLEWDFYGVINDDTDISAWATSQINTNVLSCYANNSSDSCFVGSSGWGAGSIDIALSYMDILDQIEMRKNTEFMLPEGRMKLCFDSSSPASTWSCGTSSTANSRNEYVYTIKVRWRNLLDNNWNYYAIQITNPCTLGPPSCP